MGPIQIGQILLFSDYSCLHETTSYYFTHVKYFYTSYYTFLFYARQIFIIKSSLSSPHAVGTFLLPYGVSPLAYKQAQSSKTGSAQDAGEKLSQNRESLCVKFFFLGLKMSLQSSTTVLDDVHLCQI